MEYRTLGKTGLQVSAISLGTEYLINQSSEHVSSVIHEAIAQGINYFDLFFAQPRFRDQMGAAFKGYREKVNLVAHLGAIERDGQYDRSRDLAIAEKFFHDFLTRYQTDYVDVLMVHNIDEQAEYDREMTASATLGLAKRLQREGKARFIGFSGHTVATSQQAVESGEIDVLMFPINLAGNAVPGKRELFAACVARNVGLVAMKPFGGGRLLREERSISLENFQVGGEKRQMEKTTAITPLQCLAYVLAQVGVSTIVPGCKNLAQLAATLAYWRATAEEKDFSAVVAGFQEYVSGECVYCNHCLPCPAHIDIGLVSRLLDMARGQMTAELRATYRALSTNAADCIQCGDCEKNCPFDVSVISRMEEAERRFA
jgi:hypothetical protein